MEQENNKSKKVLYAVIGVVVILLVGWFFTRGSGGLGTSIPSIPGVDIDRNIDGSATYSNEDGTVTIGANSLPDNWPNDAPKYPNASIQYSGSSNPQTGEAGAMVMFTTPDKQQTVVDFYKRELASEGWKIEQTLVMGTVTMLVAQKDERTFGVQIATDEGSGQVSVTVSVAIPGSN
ncbi:MAG: hypothetical protein AAB523_03275 [Patescibacteria group bacterium]